LRNSGEHLLQHSGLFSHIKRKNRETKKHEKGDTMREEKKREVLPRKEEHTLTSHCEETSYPHTKPNRLKKQERKLIQMNSGFTFYFDERGVCCYKKKKAS